MSLINLILFIIVVGVIFWIIDKFIPGNSHLKKILNVVLIIVAIFWLLNAFGIINGFNTIHIG